MTNRYAPLSHTDDDDAGRELEAAFDDSDNEDASETTRLTTTVSHDSPRPINPGSYDFENAEYDHPPPGSPPAVAGNSNGLIPSFDSVSPPHANNRLAWFQRTFKGLVPTRLTSQSRGPVGGGSINDGVFANVTAKPAVPTTVTTGDDTAYVVPEDARAEAPPSYAAAQADSVPPYWETTVHAPFSPDAAGEFIVDSLPTGSLFSFLWNMLISVSFQFVGFLLTYLLHTTHSARLGSRAGLGFTLIQYGFALRSRLNSSNTEDTWKNNWANWTESHSHHTFPTAAEGNANSTVPTPTMLEDDQASMLIADATTDWLSFFLMTIGWFVLLTSVLGFWRIKRWERGIVQSQQETGTTPDASRDHNQTALSQFELMFGASRSDFLRAGFGLHTSRDDAEAAAEDAVRRAEEADAIDGQDAHETDAMIPPDSSPENHVAIQQALANERRLHEELRAAGLI